MYRLHSCFRLAAVAALTLTAGLFLYGQPGPVQPNDKKDPLPTGGVVKGELKPALHKIQMTSGEKYVFTIKAKNFQPYTQIKYAAQPGGNIFTQQTSQIVMVPPAQPGQPSQQCFMQQFAYNAPVTGEFQLLLSQGFAGNTNGPLEYDIDVKVAKTIFKVEDKLTTAEPYYALRGNCYHKVHTVELKAGTTYEISMQANIPPSGPFLLLEDALGNIVQQNAGSGGYQQPRIYFQPTKTDMYRLVATTAGPSQIGNYRLSVTIAPNQGAPGGFGGPALPFPQPNPLPFPQPNPPFPKLPKKGGKGGGLQPILPPGAGLQPGLQIQPAPLPANPVPAGQNPKEVKQEDKKNTEGEVVFHGELKPNVHPFKLNSGQIYVINVRAKNFQPFVQLRNPNTKQIYITKSNSALSANGYLLSFSYTPPANDVFDVGIINMGSTLQPGPLEYTIEVTQPFFAKTEQLTNNDPVYAKRPNCRHKEYKLALRAGTTYVIELTGPFNPFLYLENANGQVLSSNFNGGGVNTARLIFNPPQAGDYKIIVTTLGAFQTGQFTLIVSEMPQPGAGPGVNPVPQPLPPFKKSLGATDW